MAEQEKRMEMDKTGSSDHFVQVDDPHHVTSPRSSELLPDFSRRKPSERNMQSILASQGALSILAYCASSILMTVFNKVVLSNYNFKLNFILLLVQASLTGLFLVERVVHTKRVKFLVAHLRHTAVRFKFAGPYYIPTISTGRSSKM